MDLTKIIKSLLVGAAVVGSSLMVSDSVLAKARNYPAIVKVKTVDCSLKQKLGRGSYIDSYYFDNPSQLTMELSDSDGIDKVVYGIGKSKKSRQTVSCNGSRSKKLTFDAFKNKDKTYNVVVKDSKGKKSGFEVYMRAYAKTSLRIRTSKSSSKVMNHGGIFYLDTFYTDSLGEGTPSKFDLIFKDGDGISKIEYLGSKFVNCDGSVEAKLSFSASKKGNRDYNLRMYDCAGNTVDVEMLVRGAKSKFRAKKKFKSRSKYKHGWNRIYSK